MEGEVSGHATFEEVPHGVVGIEASVKPGLAQFLLQTGVRISEALGLTWGNVELGTKPHVKVRQQRYKGVVKALKTPTANRDVPLSKGMVDALIEQRTRAYSGEDGPVWCSVLGKGVRRRYSPSRITTYATE